MCRDPDTEPARNTLPRSYGQRVSASVSSAWAESPPRFRNRSNNGRPQRWSYRKRCSTWLASLADGTTMAGKMFRVKLLASSCWPLAKSEGLTAKSCPSLPVRIFHPLPSLFRFGIPRICGHHRLVLPHRQIPFLELVIHLARSQIRLLQEFRIGPRNLTDHLVSRSRSLIFFLAAQQVAQSERCDFVVQAAILSLAPVLPDPAILLLSLSALARRPQQVRLFQRQKVVARKPRTEDASDLQSLVIAMLAAQEDHEHDPGVHAGFAIRVVLITQIPKSFFFVAAQSNQRDGHSHRQRQVSHHVVMGSNNQFGIGVLRS